MSPVSGSSNNRYRSVGEASSHMGFTLSSLIFDGLPALASSADRLAMFICGVSGLQLECSAPFVVARPVGRLSCFFAAPTRLLLGPESNTAL